MNDVKQGTKKCAVYARSARSGPSMIETQVDRCRDAARAHGWVVDEAWIRSDEGKNSIKPIHERPGLQLLVHAVKTGTRPFDCLIIADNSYLSRKVAEILTIHSMFSRCGVAIHVVSSDAKKEAS